MTGGKKREVYIEIDELDTTLTSITKEYAHTKEKLQRTISVYDQLVDWAKKYSARLAELDETTDLDIPSGPNISQGQDALAGVFEVIAAKLQTKLEPVKERRESAIREITTQQRKNVHTILAEVNHSEFMNKNVRVAINPEDKSEEEDEDDLEAIEEGRRELVEERQTAKRDAKSREE